MSALVRYDFEVKENEQLEVAIKLPEDNRGVIYGTVVDCKEKPVGNAVVKLFEVCKKRDKKDSDWDDRRRSEGMENFNLVDIVEEDGEFEGFFKKKKDCDLCPITHTFTDECGQFIFGPLCPYKKYAVIIWKNNICIKTDCFEEKADKECLSCCGKDKRDKDECGKDEHGKDERGKDERGKDGYGK